MLNSKVYTKKCVICGKEYKSISVRALTCGKQCRNELWEICSNDGEECKMKKKLITAIIAVVLLIAGCGDKVNVSAGQDRMMEKVEDEWGYAIYVDKDTNVMYIKGSGDGGAFTVMLNADGTPKIWQREE